MMFQALLHHLGRALTDKRDCDPFTHSTNSLQWTGDCEAETVAEVDALEQRLQRIERKLRQLEGDDQDGRNEQHREQAATDRPHR